MNIYELLKKVAAVVYTIIGYTVITELAQPIAYTTLI